MKDKAAVHMAHSRAREMQGRADAAQALARRNANAHRADSVSAGAASLVYTWSRRRAREEVRADTAPQTFLAVRCFYRTARFFHFERR